MDRRNRNLFEEADRDMLDPNAKATAVMDSICSTCLSSTYMLCANLAGLVVLIIGLIWIVTSASCDQDKLGSQGLIYFCALSVGWILRFFWCKRYLLYPRHVINVFAYEHILWNRRGR
eukprot:TRINITY_DN6949_c0_g1_i1.p1 TRINITY_DN6949_c0_g1~~TRINITY_DN6949_c0_g1_i1.p1  ORF type:complete len:118 (-),score=17.95 TRINITY_DN6949_c0_g1_i1:65-418(-)